MPHVKNLHDEVYKKLSQEARVPSAKAKLKFSLQDPTNVEYRKKYIGTKLEFMALATPQEKKVHEQIFDSLQSFSTIERLNIWDQIWQTSTNYHVLSQALMGMGRTLETTPLDEQTTDVHIWKTTQSWANKLDNWAHSDTLSKIYAKLLDRSLQNKNSKLLASHTHVRNKWNRSKNPWHRRQSIVSLLYYSAGREKYLPFRDLIAYVDALIEDPAFYVQRGVGWTLRELSNVYPQKTYVYLEKNILRLSAIAFSASTEKLSKSEKLKLKKLRAKR